jgi:hypothetical protein
LAEGKSEITGDGMSLANASKSFPVCGLKKLTLTRIFHEKQRKSAGNFLNFTGQFEYHRNPNVSNLY